nr:hypothetical protein CFP56_21131 [Quercus suber]
MTPIGKTSTSNVLSTDMNSSTAIILIDPYNDFLHPNGKLNQSVADSLAESHAVPNLQKLLGFARQHRVPVFYCLHQQTHAHVMHGWQHKNSSLSRLKESQVFEAGSWGAEYFDGMAPDLNNGDVVISKHWNSRFVVVRRWREQASDQGAS